MKPELRGFIVEEPARHSLVPGGDRRGTARVEYYKVTNYHRNSITDAKLTRYGKLAYLLKENL